MRGHRRIIRAGGMQGAEAGSASVITPKSIFGSSLELWLRADLGITLNGGNVSAWADQSGKGDANRNALQGTAALQPLWTAAKAAYAGMPVVDFGVAHADGEALVTGAFGSAPNQPLAIYVVGNAASAGTNNYFLDSLSTVTETYLISNHSATRYETFAGVTDFLAATEVTAASVLGWQLNGASSKMYKNAVTEIVSGPNGANNPTGFTIGNYAGLGNFSSKGPIAEVIVASGAFNANRHASVMRYLGARYGIAIGA